jgi:hypothetical protein
LLEEKVMSDEPHKCQHEFDPTNVKAPLRFVELDGTIKVVIEVGCRKCERSGKVEMVAGVKDMKW